MKIILIIAASILVILATAVYNLWAWSYILEWFWNGYFIKHVAVTNLTHTASLCVVILLGIIYTFLNLDKYITKAEYTSKTWSEISDDIIGASIVVILAPWLSMITMKVVIWWFAL